MPYLDVTKNSQDQVIHVISHPDESNRNNMFSGIWYQKVITVRSLLFFSRWQSSTIGSRLSIRVHSERSF